MRARVGRFGHVQSMNMTEQNGHTVDELDELIDSWLVNDETPHNLPSSIETGLRRSIRQVFECEEAKLRTAVRLIMDEELRRFRSELQKELTNVMRNAALSAAKSVKRHVQAVANDSCVSKETESE